MIVSMIQHHNYLISLNNQNNINVHQVGDFVSLNSIPKIYSPLGIVLRQPISSFKLPLQSNPKMTMSNTINNLLIIYDNQCILFIDLNLLCSEIPEIKVLKRLELNKIISNSTTTTFISSLMTYERENIPIKLIVTTTSGKIISLSIQNIQEDQTADQTYVIKDIKSLMTNQIIQEEKNHLIASISQQKQIQYATACLNYESSIFFGTNQGRLLRINPQTLELISQFNLDLLLQTTKKTYTNLKKQITKLIQYRNSILALYEYHIIQYNLYTNSSTRFLFLPVKTLDFAISQSQNKLDTRIMMVGECNSLYSTNYNMNTKQKQVIVRSVGLSNRIGKCMTALESTNYIFVGGNDNVIDVFKADSLFMVLMRGKQ